MTRRLLRYSLCLALLSCTAPEIKFARQAEAYGLVQSTLQGPRFQHRVYRNAQVQTQNEILHIYLGGDGSPWIQHRWIASNPTPRNSFILQLMQQDTRAALFLGRPCYHGLMENPLCRNTLWTDARYGEEVIQAMANAITQLTQQYAAQKIVLIGFSGGGTLAVLLSEHVSKLHGLITIAANLDTTAWTKHHGYSPLFASLNPMQRPRILPTIWQLHLAGAKDSNIPRQHIQAFVDKQPNAELLVFNDYTHRCCWVDIWPNILQSIPD